MNKPRDYSDLTIEQKATILDELARMLDGKAEFSHRKKVINAAVDPMQSVVRIVDVYEWKLRADNCSDIRRALTAVINPEL